MTSHRSQNGSSHRRDLDLARGLSQGEIHAHFLPKVDLRSARVVGVEALARWGHPSEGMITAGAFMDLVETGAHHRALTERIIEFSTRAGGDWWRSGLGLQLSINLPLAALAGSGWDLPRYVSAALSASGLPGDALQFEVTENDLIAQPDFAAEVIGQLSGIGATLCVDDFGTGHFSLRQLKSLPIEELKIDRSLVAGLSDEVDRSIVRSIIHLSHQMNIQVVGEGVETEATWRQLRSMGCERAQGFLIARPLPAREVPAWLASWNQRSRDLRITKRVRRATRSARRRAATAV
jgi:EAL domain-containing protein (putative c-di-GMP-specific phosphodiesterase class I)